MNENNHINDGTTSSDRMIHTPSSFARKNLSFVQEIGELKSIRAHSSVRENMDSYLFFIVEEGSGIVNTSGYDFTVNTGDCVFLDCKNIMSIQALIQIHGKLDGYILQERL